MAKAKTVYVRQRHIERARRIGGIPYTCTTCPIALALNDAFGVEAATASPDWLTIESDGYKPPKSVSAFIFDYDHGHQHSVKPFKFQLTRKKVIPSGVSLEVR